MTCLYFVLEALIAECIKDKLFTHCYNTIFTFIEGYVNCIGKFATYDVGFSICFQFSIFQFYQFTFCWLENTTLFSTEYTANVLTPL